MLSGTASQQSSSDRARWLRFSPPEEEQVFVISQIVICQNKLVEISFKINDSQLQQG